MYYLGYRCNIVYENASWLDVRLIKSTETERSWRCKNIFYKILFVNLSLNVPANSEKGRISANCISPLSVAIISISGCRG